MALPALVDERVDGAGEVLVREDLRGVAARGHLARIARSAWVRTLGAVGPALSDTLTNSGVTELSCHAPRAITGYARRARLGPAAGSTSVLPSADREPAHARPPDPPHRR